MRRCRPSAARPPRRAGRVCPCRRSRTAPRVSATFPSSLPPSLSRSRRAVLGCGPVARAAGGAACAGGRRSPRPGRRGSPLSRPGRTPVPGRTGPAAGAAGPLGRTGGIRPRSARSASAARCRRSGARSAPRRAPGGPPHRPCTRSRGPLCSLPLREGQARLRARLPAGDDRESAVVGRRRPAGRRGVRQSGVRVFSRVPHALDGTAGRLRAMARRSDGGAS